MGGIQKLTNSRTDRVNALSTENALKWLDGSFTSADVKTKEDNSQGLLATLQWLVEPTPKVVVVKRVTETDEKAFDAKVSQH